MRVSLVVLVPLLVSSAAAADTDWIAVDRVVAVVNRDVILDSEVNRLLDAEAAAVPETDRARHRAARRRPVIEGLIDDTLILQRGQLAQITVDPAEVEAAITEIRTQNQLDDAGLDAALGQAGFTRAQYRIEVGNQLRKLRTINTLVRQRIVITDAETRAIYDQKKAAGATDKSYADLKSEIYGQLYRVRLDAEVPIVLAEWRATAYIDVRAP